jgi:hypothetical protein
MLPALDIMAEQPPEYTPGNYCSYSKWMLMKLITACTAFEKQMH